MESTKLTKVARKTSKQWEEEFTLQKKELVKGKWGMEGKTQYFPVKKQYESFAELQYVIDNNFAPLKLGRVVDMYNDHTYLKSPIIYLRDDIKDHHFDTNEFLQYFFTLYNHECATFNSKTGKQQCDQGRRRSLIDLYRICKYYYPLVTIKDVKEALWNLPFGMQVFICPDVRRRVHRREMPSNHHGAITYNNADEFGWDYYCTNVKDSKYFKMTYKELVPIINKTLKGCTLSPIGYQGIDPNVEWYSTNNAEARAKAKPELLKPITTNVTPVPVLVDDTNELPF